MWVFDRVVTMINKLLILSDTKDFLKIILTKISKYERWIYDI